LHGSIVGGTANPRDQFFGDPELEMAAALQINCDYATMNLSLPEYLDYLMACGQRAD
jgi:hypothetical protein